MRDGSRDAPPRLAGKQQERLALVHGIRTAVEAATRHSDRSESHVLDAVAPETQAICKAVEAVMRHGLRVRVAVQHKQSPTLRWLGPACLYAWALRCLSRASATVPNHVTVLHHDSA